MQFGMRGADKYAEDLSIRQIHGHSYFYNRSLYTVHWKLFIEVFINYRRVSAVSKHKAMASQGAHDIIRDCDGLDPRWVAPICGYYDNLRIGGVNCREIHRDIQRIRSLGDLINEIIDLPYLDLQFSESWLGSFERFKLILDSFDGLVAAINT